MATESINCLFNDVPSGSTEVDLYTVGGGVSSDNVFWTSSVYRRSPASEVRVALVGGRIQSLPVMRHFGPSTPVIGMGTW